MKYVRTKDKIILNPAPLDCGNCEYGTYMGEDAKQANTIEELCDEIVVITEYGNKTHREVFSIDKYSVIIAKSYLKLKTPHKIYYAIWTNKGLIYVAKMNDEGVLELC